MKAAAEVLLDPARAIVALRGAGLRLDSLELTYRRSSETGGLAAYRLRGTGIAGEPATSLGYACWAPPDRLSAMLQLWRSGRAEPGAFGDGVRAIPSLPAVLFLAPNDRKLEMLPSVLDVARLARLLAPLSDLEPAGWRVRESESAVRVLRYEPEHRAVARVSLALEQAASRASRSLDAIVRVFGDDRGASLHADLTAWRDGGASAVLPRSLGAPAHGRLHVEEVVEGEPLLDAVLAGRVEPEAVSEALATLHGSRVRLTRTRAADERLAQAHVILGELRNAGMLDVPGVAAVAGPLTAALPVVRPPRPVHGALHARHVLASETALSFVDLECRALGDPFDDSGSLVAHLLWESRARLPEGAPAGAFAARLAALARASQPQRPWSELAFFIAAALVELAQRPLLRHAPNAAAEARLALQLAREVLSKPA